MGASPPSAVLTQADPVKEFQGQPGQTRPIATSGDIGGATLRLQYRIRESDDWEDDPNSVFLADEHISGRIHINAVFNRIIADGATGATDVAVQL